MSKEELTSDVSKRICSHMNLDHKQTLRAFAEFYGGFKDAKDVSMIEINTKLIKLEVDAHLIEISFDHELTDSQDAHQTIVSMSKSLPKRLS